MTLTTLSEIRERFTEYNETNNITYGMHKRPSLSAVIVYKQSNFTKEYSEVSRSYRVDNLSGKAFFNGMIGNSIYGDCLDGSEYGVRLDAYNWDIDFCYFE